MIKKCVAMLVLFCASIAPAQWVDSDGEPVTDISPQFKYYPFDDPSGAVDQYGQAFTAGSFTVVNAGPNGVTDSGDNSTRGGDDTGLISLLVSVADASMPVEIVLPVFGDGIAWGAPVGFGGKIQLSGNAIAASFLPVSETETVLFRLPGGLSACDFLNADEMITIEMGNNDSFGTPGRTLFTEWNPEDTIGALSFGLANVNCVPEPSSLALLSTALLAALGHRRHC